MFMLTLVLKAAAVDNDLRSHEALGGSSSCAAIDAINQGPIPCRHTLPHILFSMPTSIQRARTPCILAEEASQDTQTHSYMYQSRANEQLRPSSQRCTSMSVWWYHAFVLITSTSPCSTLIRSRAS